MEISDPVALSSSLNITNIGEIPIGHQQTWAMAFHCAPYDAEIDLTIRINVSLSKKNTTRFEFKRKKICLRNQTLGENGPQEVLVAASGTSTGGQVFYAAIGCACAFVAAICVIVIAYYVRDKKSRRHRDPLQLVFKMLPITSKIIKILNFYSIKFSKKSVQFIQGRIGETVNPVF